MRRNALLVFCAFSLLAGAQTVMGQQTLVYQDNFPAGNFQFQKWLDTLQPTRLAVTTPASPMPATITIGLSIIGCGVVNTACSAPGIIYTNPTPAIPNQPWTGPDYQEFTHELMHQSLPVSVLLNNDTGFIEGLATGKKELIYANLHGSNSSLFPANQAQPNATCAASIDVLNNRKPNVFGGATSPNGLSDFYGNLNNAFDSVCAVVTHLMERLGGNFQKFDAAVNATLPKNRADFLTIADSFGVMIDGVLPSTMLKRDVTNITGVKDGNYFGIQSMGGLTYGSYQAVDSSYGSPFNPIGYFPMFAAFSKGEPTAIDATFGWTLTDASGKTLVKRTGLSVKNPFAMLFSNDPTLDPKKTGLWYANYPTGAYKVSACIESTPGNCADPNDPKLNDSDVFAIVNENLNPGDVAVATNGDAWGNLTTNQLLNLVSPGANSVTVEQYAGLYIYRNISKTADGGFSDITLTDSVQKRTLAPDRRAPSFRTFHDRDLPILNSITRTTDYKTVSGVTPGALYALWGSNFTANDPMIATTFPIPTTGLAGTATNDQGRTVVIFTTPGGLQFKAPVLYTGFGQINIMVPDELGGYVGQTVTAVVSTNGTPSDALNLTVVSQDPGAFVLDPAANTAAAVIATGSNIGKTVSAETPASGGTFVSLFGTGLGPKMMMGTDGEPMMGANATQAVVLATIGGQPAEVSYSGCAPGFVGLDQVNIKIPMGLAGNVPVVIIANGVTSVPVMLAVQ